MTTTRRQLLRTGWKIGGGLLGVAAVWTAYESLRPFAGQAEGAAVKLGSPANYPNGTATYVPEGRLFIVNASGHLFALSQKCPHLGCRIPFCDSSGRFECPCHGSKYDLAGEWIEGPAPRGMDRYDLKLANGTLEADTSKVITGPDRGTKDFLTPAKGPACAPKV